MYMLPKTNYLRRSLTTHTSVPTVIDRHTHNSRVKQALILLGVSPIGLWMLESRYLPRIIHADEQLGGVVYGFYDNGTAMLVATDRRVIFLDKKPLFVNEDEITFAVVSGVKLSHSGLGCMVTLHTRVKDYKIRSFNTRSAKKFVKFIESRCLENPDIKEDPYDTFDQTS